MNKLDDVPVDLCRFFLGLNGISLFISGFLYSLAGDYEKWFSRLVGSMICLGLYAIVRELNKITGTNEKKNNSDNS